MVTKQSGLPKHIDYDFVAQIRTTVLRTNQVWYNDVVLAERAYNGEIDLGIDLPAGAPRHVPATAMATVDNAVAHIVSDFPRVQIRAPGVGVRAEKRQELLREAAAYAFDRLNTATEEDVWAAVKFDLVQLGAACIKCVFDEEAWPEPPPKNASDEAVLDWKRERRSAWPFATFTVHPASVIVPPDRSWPHRFVIETQQRTALDMWTRYPDWHDPERNSDPMRVVEWTEYWDAEHYICWADGVEVFRKPNIHGVPPYIWLGVARGRRGSTITSQRGSWTRGVYHPGDNGPKGILAGAVMSQLQAEARLMTLLDLLWQLDVFPRLLVQRDEAKALENAWNTGPGGILPVEKPDGPDKSAQWLDMPQLNAAMFQFLPLVQHSIQNSTFDPALTGERPAGVDYGVHQALLIGQARQALRPFVSALDQMGGMWANLVLRYIDTILDESLQLPSGATIAAADIAGYYQARCTFESVSEADDDRRVALGLQVLAVHAEPHRTVLEKYFKSENPSEELAQLFAEQVVAQLVQSGAVSQAVMNAAQMNKAEDQLKTQIGQATGQLNQRKLANPGVGQLANRLGEGQGPPLETMRGAPSPQITAG